MDCDEIELQATRNRRKTADEMFEELGYWLDMENYVYCIWVNDYREIIKFNKERKEFYKAIGYEQFEYITMQELQAINKKVEELGWK